MKNSRSCSLELATGCTEFCSDMIVVINGHKNSLFFSLSLSFTLSHHLVYGINLLLKFVWPLILISFCSFCYLYQQSCASICVISLLLLLSKNGFVLCCNGFRIDLYREEIPFASYAFSRCVPLPPLPDDIT